MFELTYKSTVQRFDLYATRTHQWMYRSVMVNIVGNGLGDNLKSSAKLFALDIALGKNVGRESRKFMLSTGLDYDEADESVNVFIRDNTTLVKPVSSTCIKLINHATFFFLKDDLHNPSLKDMYLSDK